MYSKQSLEGSESFSFWNYWNSIKSYIGEMKGLGAKIKTMRDEFMYLRNRAEKADPSLVPQINAELKKTTASISTWMRVRSAIDKWVPQFMKIEREAKTESGVLHGLDLLPLALPAWALITLGAGGLSAIAFIATTGMSLIKDYKFQKQVLESVRENVITAEQAKGIIVAGRGEGFFSNLGAKLGNLGTVGTMGLLGVGGLFLYSKFK